MPRRLDDNDKSSLLSRLPGLWVARDTLIDQIRSIEQLLGFPDSLLSHIAAPTPANEPAAAKKGPVPDGKQDGNVCPICGFKSVSRHALGQHMGTRHQISLSKYQEGHAKASMAKMEQFRKMKCPECGQRFGGAQGVSAHMRALHNTTYGNWKAQHESKKEAS